MTYDMHAPNRNVNPEVVKILVQHNCQIRYDDVAQQLLVENTFESQPYTKWLPLPETVYRVRRWLGY